MKKHILAISVIVLMLFASCDPALMEIMGKMGQNIAPGEAPEIEVTVGTTLPETKDDGVLSQVGGLLLGATGMGDGSPVSMVSGLTEDDTANLIELSAKNPEAIEELKAAPAAPEAQAAAGTTAQVLSGVLNEIGVGEMLNNNNDSIPAPVKDVLNGIVESVTSATGKPSGELTQGDVIAMQVISGIMNDIVDAAVSSLPADGEEGVVINGVPVTQGNLIDIMATPDGTAVIGAIVSESLPDIVSSSLDSITTTVDVMNIMGMTGGVDANALISGLLGSL